MKIGFIGLGNMGAPMAANLAKAGHEVFGYDTAEVSVEGVTQVCEASQATIDMDAVITMLPDGRILKSVYEQIVPLGKPGALFLDCSTVDMLSSKSAHQQAAEAGLLSVDAPVSGGMGGAIAGTLTFMVGSSAEAFEQVKPLLDIMGKRVVHCGEGGAGQAAKICNNMLLGISMIGTCEAFALGEKLGLDAERLFEVMSTSSGSCWSVNTYCPVPGVGPSSPADNGYKPGFAAELMLKDLRLSQNAAEQVDASTPMGLNATRIYEKFVEREGLGKDFSAMLLALAASTRGQSND
ncbi:3-hydroxyisobutyrate dehydrogenase [Granulosicoccus antarcticus]|uniref:3-hydroxyisobutyrate dehydrogenase n=1 Tax=Granulosicoccus antarcticus IMCC3135 TaxID=1192854 RepID=A0A2Z2NVR8_9GAMM|nr:3-hydroxyisobutyrate dehydrogenase [Granulosicoccus antarcticus]ASJ72890.1 putative 3-hydroxyisobutyrate dehydrogenase [Granulosicoccus antarcticus IMCC3135]